MDTAVTLSKSTMGHHQYIPLAKLTASPLNHRKIFNKEKMEQLAASVRTQGVIQPILARPLGEAFEVVAGERRFRAAKMAGLADMPAVVRELTDLQVLELQITENWQRENPHELEEAEAYEALMTCPRPDGSHYSAEQIAAKVGKSKAYVYARLKLTALGEAGRKAFYDGRLDASRALLLARIPVPALQDEALAQILGFANFKEFAEYKPDPDDADEEEDFQRRRAMSVRAAADHIQWTYMLRLKDAPFDVKAVYLVQMPGHKNIGPMSVHPCGECQMRTGAQPELFPDVDSADVCTDPSCFGRKRAAHLNLMHEKAAAKGKDVVAPKAKGYVKLDDRVRGDWNGRTYRELLGKQAPEPQLMPAVDHQDKAKMVEVVRKADIQEVVQKKLEKQRAGRADPAAGPPRDYAAEHQLREAVDKAVFACICSAIPLKPGKRELTYLLERVLADYDTQSDLVAELFLPPAKGGADGEARLRKVLPQLDEAGLLRLLVALRISLDSSYEDSFEIGAKLYEVDAAAIEAELKKQSDDIRAGLKAADAAAKAEKKSAPAKKKAKK